MIGKYNADVESENYNNQNDLLKSDPQLNEVAAKCEQRLGINGLVAIANAYQKFNEPFLFSDYLGKEQTDKNFYLRRMLAAMPDIIDNAICSDLSVAQIEDLAVSFFNASDGSCFIPPENSIEISLFLIGKIFKNASERSHFLDEKEFGEFKGMIIEAAQRRIDQDVLYAISLTERMGFSILQSKAIISELMKAGGNSASSYTFAPFCDALKTLNIAEVDPDLIIEIFKKLGGSNPYYNIINYDLFAEVITFFCPSNDISPKDAMQLVLQRVGNGQEIKKVLMEIIATNRDKISGNGKYQNEWEIVDEKQKINRHFIQKKGNLEIAALPYQLKKDFSSGIKDLKNIVNANSLKYDEIGEGFWLYDPDSGTWYSFGGKTGIKNLKSIEHNMISFEIDKLSIEPIMIHCHPKEDEIFLWPGDFDISDYRAERIKKFSAAIPSLQDYKNVAELIDETTKNIKSRSFIANSLGVTEFEYPNDVEQIKNLANLFQDIRDRVIAEFDWESAENNFILLSDTVKKLIFLLNTKLPEGFSINLHSYDDDFDLT